MSAGERSIKAGQWMWILLLGLALSAPAQDQQRMRFRVVGRLDDPILGKIEDAVTERLREFGLRDIRVERHGKALIEVQFPAKDRDKIPAVKKALARPDRLLLAMAATLEEIRAVFGLDMDEGALRQLMEKVKGTPVGHLGIPLYRNPRDPTRPPAKGAEPFLYYHPLIPLAEAKDKMPGVLVVARPELRCTHAEIEEIRVWEAKVTSGFSFVPTEKARTSLRALAAKKGDLCVILNGRCAFRQIKSSGSVGVSELINGRRFSICTSVMGTDLSRRLEAFRAWVDRGGHRRKLVPIVGGGARRKI